MNLMVCLDNSYGLSFFGRRQSMDSALRRRAMELTEGKQLYLDAYSAEQFSDFSGSIQVVEDPAGQVPQDGWYFLELSDPEALLQNVQRLAVFCWNRDYPSDKRFPLAHLRKNAVLLFREEFPGSSHESITLEVYQL